jgi:hypothetical protein
MSVCHPTLARIAARRSAADIAEQQAACAAWENCKWLPFSWRRVACAEPASRDPLPIVDSVPASHDCKRQR